MIAAFIREHGDADRIEVGDVARCDPQGHEVLVRGKAAAMNHLDIWGRATARIANICAGGHGCFAGA